MQRWLIAAGALLAVVACDRGSTVAGPNHSAPTADAVASDAAIYIVNFDETQTTQDAVTTGILNTGAGVVQFDNFSMVAALATPAQLLTISALPGLDGVYANKQLDYYMLHESVPAIRADAVHVAGITGKGIGVAILDSGIDGAYNADVAYPQYTVQNVKVLGGNEADVREAVETVVNDAVIHGTYVYDKEQTLTGAEAQEKSKILGDWKEPGKIYFKVFYNALAPRNFKGSEDQGTITVRYVLQEIALERFRIRIDAVFAENEHRTVHPSEGVVESSEFKEITERLKAIQLQTQKNVESKARIDAQIAVKQELLRRRQEEATKLSSAESSQSVREMPHLSAIISADWCCGTKV